MSTERFAIRTTSDSDTPTVTRVAHCAPLDWPCVRVPPVCVSVEKGETKLKHAAAPKESAALTQAKVLKAVEGKHELQHVETKGGSGLTEAQKEAFKNKVKDDEE